MTGPEHLREGEKRLKASDWQRQEAGEQFMHGNEMMQGAMHEAAMAQAHFTAANAYANLLLAGQAIPQDTP